MPWHQIGETAHCAGRLDPYTNSRGKLRTLRCPTVLWVGSWFYLHASKPYCEACAIDPQQEVNAEPRRVIEPSARRAPLRDHAMVARHQADLDDL